MNGSAPNSPETGSQTFPVQNLKPNFSSESCDVRKSSQKIPATSRTTSRAKNPVPRRKPRSSALRREDGVFFMGGSCSETSELDSLERFHLESHDIRRQRRVAHVARELLPVGQGPLHELDHRLGLRLVLGVLVEEQPRERRDRI